MLEVASLITRNALSHAGRIGVVVEEERFTWGEFGARVAKTGNFLRSLGVGKGQRVATVLPNCRELLEVFWACPTIGAVLVPLSPMLRDSGLARLIGDAAPTCVITSPALHPAVLSAVDTLPSNDRPAIVVTEGGGVASLSYAEATAAASADLQSEACAPEDSFNI